MLFNSIEYLIFFPIVIFFYFLLPHKIKWAFLLAASYYFYMCWKIEYILLIIISTLIDYYAALQMAKHKKNKRRRTKFLILSLCSNLGILFGFKYFNFFNNSVHDLFNHFNIFYNVPVFDVLLPVGISFYTFQTLSYTIDVYNGKKIPERHLGYFALYVSFFPQLVAGPIERSNRLLPQFYKESKFNYEDVVHGLRLMLWGFFKKVVIADRLAYFVNTVYNSPSDFYGFQLIIATVFFAFQIFCDFSGYSDIAIGTARIMGYRLMNNFDRPYSSQFIAEFWKRWHISLSTWFRDYLYIPLGGNRVTKWRWYYNLLITFIISGLWHGANWTFIAWGLIHGIYLILGIVTDNLRNTINKKIGLIKFPNTLKYWRKLKTFSLVVFAWIFFRANNIDDAFTILKNVFTFNNESFNLSFVNKGELVISIVLIVFLEMIHFLQKDYDFNTFMKMKPQLMRWAIYIFLILSIVYIGKYNVQDFIYFQF